MPRNPTRAPKPPPFKVGERVRYIGTSKSEALDIVEGREVSTPIIYPGMEVTITEAKPGRRGTGQQLRDHDGPMFYEDTGDPILDETEDGYCAYEVPGPRGQSIGRLIRREYAKQWERVK